MPVRIELLTEIVIWLIVGVFAVTIGFVLATVQRRINRRRYFEKLDLARQRAQEVVEPFYQKKLSLESTIASIAAFRTKAERQALEDALLRHTKIPEELALTRAILRQTGRIREWIDQLRCRAAKPTGQAARILAEVSDSYRPAAGIQRIRLRLNAGFLTRCFAADKLARVPTPEGLCALVAGISDPHLDVQEICIRHLGALADPVVLPVLLEELVKVIEGQSRISTRSIKATLVQYPIEEADDFIPVLKGSNRRARFFAVDVLREIADRRAAAHGLMNKNDFSPALYRLFLEQLSQDQWGDVRARAAAVIAHFHDPASYSILEKLSQDKEWFVRLHTCRAVGTKFFLPVAPALGQCLTDKHWLVREAAVRSLMAMGDLGTEQIIRAFLASNDRFTTEQISEEVQRSGLLITLLDSLDEAEKRDQTLLVIRKMIFLGKVSMLLAYLVSPVSSTHKRLLIKELSACHTLECQLMLQHCAERDSDPDVRAAALNALQAQGALAQANTTMPTMRGD